jgi:hypothetical protein
MQRLSLLCFLLFFGSTLPSLAQYQWDFGVGVGFSNYLGEIGGEEETRRDFIFDMKLNRTQYVVGGFARYKFSPTFSFNLGANYGRIRANDYNSKNPARVARNLSFRNNIFELSGRAEITLFYDNDVSGRGYYNPDFKIYGFVGAGVMHHNPKVVYYGELEEFNGEMVELQPLQTEGVDYSRWQFTLPAGLGLYFTYNKVHRFGWEIGYRTTFTDYLDDVSTEYVAFEENTLAGDLANRTTPEALETAEAYAEEFGLDVPNAESFDPGEKRGDPTNNDGYLFTQFTYSYVLKGKSSFYKRRYNWIKRKSRKRRKSRAKF